MEMARELPVLGELLAEAGKGVDGLLAKVPLVGDALRKAMSKGVEKGSTIVVGKAVQAGVQKALQAAEKADKRLAHLERQVAATQERLTH